MFTKRKRFHVVSSEAGILLPDKLTQIIEAYMGAAACVVESFMDGDAADNAIEIGWYLLETSIFSSVIDEKCGYNEFKQDMHELLNKLMR